MAAEHLCIKLECFFILACTDGVADRVFDKVERSLVGRQTQSWPSDQAD